MLLYICKQRRNDMKKGYIYIIKNSINNKVYIGQTTKTPQERFKIHVKDSKREDKTSRDYHIYRAMKKYGIENFYVEEIEECEIEELDEKEIYYIALYDAYYNGYNSTLGGGGRRIVELDEDMVIAKYNTYKSISKIARELGHSTSTIRTILVKNDVHIEDIREKGISIMRCDENRNTIETYECTNDAARWIIKEFGLTNKSTNTIAQSIRNHMITETEYKGFYWKTESLTKEEIENRRNRLEEQWTSPNRVRTYNIKKDTCPCCGGIKMAKTTMCAKCQTKNESKKARANRETKVSREELKTLIRNKNFKEIGEIFEVSDNAIRKWCVAYNLPCKAREIAKMSDKEWAYI